MTTETIALPDNPPPVDINARKSKKTAYYSATIAKKLLLAERETASLQNNPTTIKIMQPFGYTPEKIAEFTRIYQETARAQIMQTKEIGEKVGAYAEFESLFTIAKNQIHYLAKIAKIAFRNDEHALSTLHLNSRKPRKQAEILDFMNNFYQQALMEKKITAVLANYNYPAETLRSYQEHYLKTHARYNDLNKESADATMATKTRDDLLAVLDEWMYEFYSIAKVAYALNPHWLQEQQLEEQEDEAETVK